MTETTFQIEPFVICRQEHNIVTKQLNKLINYDLHYVYDLQGHILL